MLSLNLQKRKTTLQSVDKAPLTLAQDFLWQAYSARSILAQFITYHLP